MRHILSVLAVLLLLSAVIAQQPTLPPPVVFPSRLFIGGVAYGSQSNIYYRSADNRLAVIGTARDISQVNLYDNGSPPLPVAFYVSGPWDGQSARTFTKASGTGPVTLVVSP
jgi:hypothetical protein